MTESVYVPGIGFRSANALRMPERTIVRQGERALAVTTLVSSAAATEVSFEIQDDRLEEACLAGKLEHSALINLDVRLRDDDGNSYARSITMHDGFGLGQHEFGFFERGIDFDPLRADVRRVVLEVDGAFGAWAIPVEVLLITETGVAVRRSINRATTKHGISVRLIGIALREEETVVELDATWTPPIAAIHGIGAMRQRQGDDRLVLVDGQGRRYEEELSRETVRHARDTGERTTAKFPPLPADATLELALPVTEPREVHFGPYPMRLGPASVVHDLLEASGKPPGYGLRFVLGPHGWHDGRRALRPMRISLDGVEHKGFGSGWQPDPDMTNFERESS